MTNNEEQIISKRTKEKISEREKEPNAPLRERLFQLCKQPRTKIPKVKEKEKEKKLAFRERREPTKIKGVTEIKV